LNVKTYSFITKLFKVHGRECKNVSFGNEKQIRNKIGKKIHSPPEVE